MIYLHQNLKYLRKQVKLSQAALAETLSLSRSNIAAYEAGNSEPNLTKLLKITDFFKVSIRDFISKDLASEEYIKLHQINKNASNLAIEQFDKFSLKTQETQEMVSGFKQFFKFRMNQNTNPSRELELIANDYENLLEVTSDLLKTNTEIIKAISTQPK